MDASRIFWSNSSTQFLGFLPSSSLNSTTLRQPFSRVWCSSLNPNNRQIARVKAAKGKGKDNVWSVDNDAANESRGGDRRKKGDRRRTKVRNSTTKSRRTSGSDEGVMVSGSMLIETENVLQTQEPVIMPKWNTFASSVSGIWKGAGAVFSPITAQMEPIDVGRNNEHQFDCYTLSRIEAVPSTDGTHESHIQRTVNWVTLNPHGENRRVNKNKEDASLSSTIEALDGRKANHVIPKFESFNFETSDVMEEDLMGMEPGLVFFEDGSYSRGPVDIPVGEVNESNYFLSPTFKFEQCLVKGCHKRLRIVHTIEFSDGGSDIQIMRVAVYEEQWVSTAHLSDKSDVDFDVKPFSQRKRVQPSELSGSWKVFETSATPIYGGDEITDENEDDPPYVYLCTETLKKRSLPEMAIYFGEEEVADMVDVTVLWLPGGVTGYVDVGKDGVLCIGVGWYSDEGINLVMERDYGRDGKLKEVRSKTEVKRRWSESPSF